MIHNISYRTFVYGTEDEEKVTESISYLFENPLPEKTVNEDHFDDDIIILTQKFDKKADNKKFIKFLKETLSDEDKQTISDELERRVDEKGNLFLRFDKQCAYLEHLKLTTTGNAIHVRIKIASYPVSKENAIKVAKEKIFNFL